MDRQLTKSSREQRRALPPNIYGKVPPQAKYMEEAVLGAILLEKGAFDAVADILTPEAFYVQAHEEIFRACISLQRKGMPIDLLTMVEELRKSEKLDQIGGPYYITKLTNGVTSAVHIVTHARIILQKFIQRELIRIGGEMTANAYEDSADVFDLLESAENSLYSVTLRNLKKDYASIADAFVRLMHHTEIIRNREMSMTGVPSGFRDLDRITNGWQNDDLIILAARPSVGKTAFALNLVRGAALHPDKPTPVAIFSLEMSERQLMQRMVSAESEIVMDRITHGRIDDAAMKLLYDKCDARLAKAPIYIDDSAGLNMFELRSKCRRMKNKHNIGLVIIDYLQLMTGDSNKSTNREQEISKISRELKKLAKDLEVPIIALSQLSREVEKRGKGQKVPQLSDLRESGAIEQDADIVMFLYRPPEDEIAEDAELKNRGMVKIAKHRNGVLDELVMKFYGEVQKWMDMDDAERYEGGSGNWKRIPPPPAPFPGGAKLIIVDEKLPF